MTREEAIKDIQDNILPAVGGKSLVMAISALRQPDIIRCKDCKYYREYGYVNGKPKFLPRCTFSAIYVDADGFCREAERREDETD